MNNGCILYSVGQQQTGTSSSSTAGLPDGASEYLVSIPLLDPISNEVTDDMVEVSPENSPDEVLEVLESERADLKLWLKIAVQFYRAGNESGYRKIVDRGIQFGSSIKPRTEEINRDLVNLYCSYATSFAMDAAKLLDGREQQNSQKNQEEPLINDAKELLKRASLLDSSNSSIRAIQGIMLLLQNNIDDADREFKIAVELGEREEKIYGQSKGGLLAGMLGLANVAYRQNLTTTALDIYKSAIRKFPNSSSSVRVGLGLCFYKLGYQSRAYECFERAAKLNPRDVDALVALAIMETGYATEYSQAGTSVDEIVRNQEKSKRYMTQVLTRLQIAYELSPNNALVLSHLANRAFFKSDRDYDRISNMMHRAFENTHSKKIRAEIRFIMGRNHHAQAAEALARGDRATAMTLISEAASQYERAEKSWDGLPPLQFNYLRTQVAKDKTKLPTIEERVTKLRRTPEYADDEDFMFFHAALKTQLGMNQEALALLRKVVDLNPDNADAWIFIAQLEQRAATDVNKNDAMYAYQKAGKALNSAGKEVPSEITNNLGVLRFRRGEYEGAIRAFENALKLSFESFMSNRMEDLTLDESELLQKDRFRKENITITFNLARSFEALGRFLDAEEIYRGIISEYPAYTDAYLRLACIRHSQGRMAEAEDLCKEAIAKNPTPDAYVLYGDFLLKRGDTSGAGKRFKEASALPGHKHDPYSLLSTANIFLAEAQALPKMDQKRETALRNANGIYRGVLSLHKSNVYAANGIGAVMASFGFMTDARLVFEKIREVADTSIPDAWINLGNICIDQGAYDTAASLYRQCLKRFYNDRDPDLSLSLAYALFLSGKFSAARVELMKALHSKPSDTAMWFNMALIEEYESLEMLTRQFSTTADVRHAISLMEHSKSVMLWLAAKKGTTTTTTTTKTTAPSTTSSSKIQAPASDPQFMPHEPKSPRGNAPPSVSNMSKEILDRAKSNLAKLLANEPILVFEEEKPAMEVDETTVIEIENDEFNKRPVSERAASSKPFKRAEIAKSHAQKLMANIELAKKHYLPFHIKKEKGLIEKQLAIQRAKQQMEEAQSLDREKAAQRMKEIKEEKERRVKEVNERLRRENEEMALQLKDAEKNRKSGNGTGKSSSKKNRGLEDNPVESDESSSSSSSDDSDQDDDRPMSKSKPASNNIKKLITSSNGENDDDDEEEEEEEAAVDSSDMDSVDNNTTGVAALGIEDENNANNYNNQSLLRVQENEVEEDDFDIVASSSKRPSEMGDNEDKDDDNAGVNLSTSLPSSTNKKRRVIEDDGEQEQEL